MNRFTAGEFSFPLKQKSYVMGILNVTPDSFSDGGQYQNVSQALRHALEMEAQGADFLDIGAQSTRPGFQPISAEEELSRLLPVLEAVAGQVHIPISVDTFYPQVAREALRKGACIINDVNGFDDEGMFALAAESGCGCIIMHHMAGEDVKPYFEKKRIRALQYGIASDRLCFDPGIGFGKTYEENLRLLKTVGQYMVEGCAMLIGASRKRVIGQSCGNPPFAERLGGTIAAHTLAVAAGADIVRVHDVKEAVQACRVADAIMRA